MKISHLVVLAFSSVACGGVATGNTDGGTLYAVAMAWGESPGGACGAVTACTASVNVDSATRATIVAEFSGESACVVSEREGVTHIACSVCMEGTPSGQGACPSGQGRCGQIHGTAPGCAWNP